MNSSEILDLIDDIAQLSSRNDKEARLDAEITKSAELREVLNLTYNTFITFGVTPPAKVKGTEGGPMFDTDGEPWATLGKLAKRELTGNAAKDAVLVLLTSLEPKSSQLLYRILMKDMRAGFGKNTVNRVLPGTIVTFNVMLSHPYEAKRIKAWPVAVEPKLDGLRAMSLVTDGQSKAFSRTGNHFPALDHLSDAVVATVRTAWERANELRVAGTPLLEVFYKMLGGDAGPSIALDAEAITGGFNKTSGDVKRKSVSADDAVLHIFDAIPYSLMTGDEPEVKIPYKVRRLLVEFIVGCAAKDAPLVHTPMELANSDDEVVAIYQKHRDAGREGAMVKIIDGNYVKKKGHIWQKMKAQETEDLRITGWFTGEVGTRLQDKFAGFIVPRMHKGKSVDVRVGGGFKHAQLEEFDRLAREDNITVGSWIPGVDTGSVIGRLIEVEFHEVTPDGSLRHPRYVRFRDDKDETLRIAA